MHKLLASAVLLAALGTSHAEAASFECGKAASETEKAICADPDLSSLDDSIAHAFSELREEFVTAGDGDKDATLAAFVTTQRNWLRDRNQCGGDANCLAHQYERRLAVLKGKPDADAGTPSDRFLGAYEAGGTNGNETYGLALLKGDGNAVLALFDGASQDWTCAFSGIGTLDAKGGLTIVHRSAPPAATISLRLQATTAGLTGVRGEDNASEQYCGAGGSLAQDYHRSPDGAR